MLAGSSAPARAPATQARAADRRGAPEPPRGRKTLRGKAAGVGLPAPSPWLASLGGPAQRPECREPIPEEHTPRGRALSLIHI
eukprot:14891811-Alexandrium_andersonii.AAC.1